MRLADQEARRLNFEYLGTEHILLALVQDEGGVAIDVLRNLNISLGKIRHRIERFQTKSATVTQGSLSQTPGAKRVIESAITEARNLYHNYVGTGHLLIGLLREKDGLASQVLRDLGVELEEVVDEMLDVLGDSQEPESGEDALLDLSFESMKQRVQDRIEKVFRPEFVNRLNDTVIFDHLTADNLKQVIELELEKVRKRLGARGLTLQLTDDAKSFLIRQASELDAGARPLRRNLEKYIEDPLAEYLLRDEFQGCDTIQVEIPNKASNKIAHLSFRGIVCGADGRTTTDALTTAVD